MTVFDNIEAWCLHDVDDSGVNFISPDDRDCTLDQINCMGAACVVCIVALLLLWDFFFCHHDVTSMKYVIIQIIS